MINKRRASTIFLILGLVFLVIGIGIGMDNTTFSYAAIAFVLISLVLGGRWLRPRKR